MQNKIRQINNTTCSACQPWLSRYSLLTMTAVPISIDGMSVGETTTITMRPTNSDNNKGLKAMASNFVHVSNERNQL